MVPGMIERERLAADVQRREWLVDARVGPSRLTSSSKKHHDDNGPRHELFLALWRHGLSSALVLGRWLRLLHPVAVEARPRIADSTAR